MKHNKVKMLVGMVIMLAGFGIFVQSLSVLVQMLCLPVCCFGYGLMAMAMDASGGRLHDSLGSYASKNMYFVVGLLFGNLLALATHPDPTLSFLALRLVCLSVSILAWAAPYYASRYPAGRPLLKFVAE